MYYLDQVPSLMCQNFMHRGLKLVSQRNHLTYIKVETVYGTGDL